MKQVKDIIEGIECRVIGSEATEISALALDSRRVAEGTMFFAVVGTATDGHAYIAGAIEQGAVAIVCQQLPEQLSEGVCYVVVEDTTAVVGTMASNFYDRPSEQLKLVGITGTNGKTTTVTLLYEMFRALGYRVGLLSTVENRIDGRVVPTSHTTPDPITLNALLSEMVEVGCDYCFMEVSSHSIVQRRIGGLHFAGALFSNITHDHLDYHKTFAEYIRAKKQFFDELPREAFALVNIDDRNGEVMVQNTRARVNRLSLRSMADFVGRVIEMHLDGMLLRIDGRELWVRFLGRFNAYNLLTVYGAAVLLGADKEEVLRVLSMLESVNGRFEALRSEDGVTAIVDYAHTPDALQNVIDTINDIRGGASKLFVVVGCGGNRDKTKRPEMAQIAVRGGNQAILTSDNPRGERPDDILDDMVAGLEPTDRYLRIADRREAIRTAVMLAAAGDVILIAGKGHETYQEIEGVKHHFDDREQVREAFETLRKKAN
ncbi:MAG: UDP-N-acetylmuramoyl-L-alanyl-D-glutamate--2,6-diaminopimelate ligase [Rikenellaceae bacterium]|nr:UDP-N-acetylmuramoyl-L-alanyl-D-glutamate--2,6-diaminopimelate ligase [Rikenellaceae bacterium]